MRKEKALTRGPKLSARGRWVPVVGQGEWRVRARAGLVAGGKAGPAPMPRAGPSAKGEKGAGLESGEAFIFFLKFLFCFLFLKPFPNKILNANKFKPEANNTK